MGKKTERRDARVAQALEREATARRQRVALGLRPGVQVHASPALLRTLALAVALRP